MSQVVRLGNSRLRGERGAQQVKRLENSGVGNF
jgi:hypothetical protein